MSRSMSPKLSTHQDNDKRDVQYEEKHVGALSINWHTATVPTSRRLLDAGKVKNREKEFCNYWIKTGNERKLWKIYWGKSGGKTFSICIFVDGVEIEAVAADTIFRAASFKKLNFFLESNSLTNNN